MIYVRIVLESYQKDICEIVLSILITLIYLENIIDKNDALLIYHISTDIDSKMVTS